MSSTLTKASGASTLLLRITFTIRNCRYLRAPAKAGPIPRSTHDAKYWADMTKEFDFTREDNLKNPEKFNRIIWEGLHGKEVPYPTVRSGLDLRQNRTELLKKAAAKVNSESNS